MDTQHEDMIFCSLSYIINFIPLRYFDYLCKFALRWLLDNIVVVIVIAIYILTLGKDCIFELTVQVNECFCLKIDLVIIVKDGIASLDVHINQMGKSLLIQITNTTHIVLRLA